VEILFKIFIILASCFSLIVSYLLLIKASGRIRIFNISTFFMLFYVVFAYIGSVLLNLVEFPYEKFFGLYLRPDLLLEMWIYTTLGLYLIPLGMLLCNQMINYKKPSNTLRSVCDNELIISYTERSNVFFILLSVLFFISFVVFISYRNQIGGFPIENIFSGFSAKTLSLLRSDATNNFSGKAYRYFMFMETVPLLLLIMVSFIKDKGGRKWRLFYSLLLGYNLFFSVSTLQKGPIIKLLIVLMLMYFYKKNCINKKIIIRFGFVAVGLILLMYMAFMGQANKSILHILEGASHRIFIGQISPLYWWLRYQEEFGFLYGRSFPNPAGIFPFDSIRITVEVMNLAKGNLMAKGVVGTMPTIFFADWLINFGKYAAFFSMILFGCIIQFFDSILLNKLSKKRTLFTSTLFIYFIYFFSKYSGTSFSGLIIDTDFVFPIIIIGFLSVLSNTISKYLWK
jgi:oligosaccharide repeat unit polymerase